jgi:hypothetical protein
MFYEDTATNIVVFCATKLTNLTMKCEMRKTTETLRGRYEKQNLWDFKKAQARITEISSMFVARKRGSSASIQYYIKAHIKCLFIIMLEKGKFTFHHTVSQINFTTWLDWSTEQGNERYHLYLLSVV